MGAQLVVVATALQALPLHPGVYVVRTGGAPAGVVHVDGGSLHGVVTVVVPQTPAPVQFAGCVVSAAFAHVTAPFAQTASVAVPGFAHAVPAALHAGE